MKYAVVKTGGKQYKVSEGQILEFEKIDAPLGSETVLDKVLLYVSSDPNKCLIGRPYLKEVVVKGKVLSQKKGEKIRVAKFKSKSRYRRVTGHRQLLTQMKIESISEKKKTDPKKTPHVKKVG